MPELPEVETVKETLKLKLIGKKITAVDIYHDNIIEYPTVNEFKKQIINQTINDMSRYGKWLIFELDDYYLLSHLRMEGKYFFRTFHEERNKHEHVIFTLDKEIQLRYMDTRKFGKMHLIIKEEINKKGPLIGMGLEPWDKDLTKEYLKLKYSKKRIPIKTTLLDQSIIVGIGNIYADEILFLSNINPLTPSKDLTDKDLDNIIKHTKEVLEKAIKKGGTTIRSYTSVDGVHGLFQQELYVHNQEGNHCKQCGTTIIKTKVGGRGTYYCPKCQK
ncbi:MAG: DNA-formamidopyrimidine glycosylase [Bacilli bacterium]|nr:DNA-formamidopyrimidine glycosylase [Bacilli bacterium]